MILFCCYLLAEEVEVSFRFTEGSDKIHSLPWSELLTVDEIPFEALADITEGMKVLAPWIDEHSFNVKHAEAIIVSSTTRKKGKCQIIFIL